jgi:uncharacterized membrane protein YkvA (DUF1232 family)
MKCRSRKKNFTGVFLKLLEKIKTKVKRLKDELISIYYAYQHPEITLLPRIIILFTLGYALSPIDFIPDFIPILGYVDDLLILPLLILLSIKLIPDEIMEESREKAVNQPLILKKNWVFATVFILIWIAVLMSIVLYYLNLKNPGFLEGVFHAFKQILSETHTKYLGHIGKMLNWKLYFSINNL